MKISSIYLQQEKSYIWNKPLGSVRPRKAKDVVFFSWSWRRLLLLLLLLLIQSGFLGWEEHSATKTCFEFHGWTTAWLWLNKINAGPKYMLEKLQSVLRAVARLVLQLPYHTSVSDIMRQQLHWLEMPDHVRFKLCNVCWYTDACMDSLLTICPISAHPPRCTLSWDHLWHLNDRCLFPGRKPKR